MTEPAHNIKSMFQKHVRDPSESEEFLSGLSVTMCMYRGPTTCGAPREASLGQSPHQSARRLIRSYGRRRCRFHSAGGGRARHLQRYGGEPNASGGPRGIWLATRSCGLRPSSPRRNARQGCGSNLSGRSPSPRAKCARGRTWRRCHVVGEPCALLLAAVSDRLRLRVEGKDANLCRSRGPTWCTCYSHSRPGRSPRRGH